MKKILFNSIFLFILFLPVMGQLRHVKGISNIGVTYGINENGSVYGAVYSQYLQTVLEASAHSPPLNSVVYHARL